MIRTIYVEDQVRVHPRVERVLSRFARATIVPCERYTEVFNPRGQSFRLQKRRPCLILAAKHGRMVLETPPGYGIGPHHNFYFSHMLNCIYDCSYCFLQGMYRSAHLVLFVNYEDFQHQIDLTLERLPAGETAVFFSGYDGDSLALEAVTRFADEFLPFFHRRPKAILELRTKSVQIAPLLQVDAFDNCVVAFSLSPEIVATGLENGAPPLEQRIEALAKVAAHGWPVGLRLDPIIHHSQFRAAYVDLIDRVFSAVPATAIHSISLGSLRFPQSMFADLARQHPYEPAFAGPLQPRERMVSYPEELESEMIDTCRSLLSGHVPAERIHVAGTHA